MTVEIVHEIAQGVDVHSPGQSIAEQTGLGIHPVPGEFLDGLLCQDPPAVDGVAVLCVFLHSAGHTLQQLFIQLKVSGGTDKQRILDLEVHGDGSHIAAASLCKKGLQHGENRRPHQCHPACGVLCGDEADAGVSLD